MNYPVTKIALFVESEVDNVIVSALVKPFLSSTVDVGILNMGGKIAAFTSAYIEVIELLPKGYQHFFILFDTETTDQFQIAYYQNLIADPIKNRGLLEYVTFCPVIPNIHAWLLGKYQLPEKQFGQKFNLPKIAKVANSIDIAALQRQNASFKWFAERLQQLTRTDKVVLKRAA